MLSRASMLRPLASRVGSSAAASAGGRGRALHQLTRLQQQQPLSAAAASALQREAGAAGAGLRVGGASQQQLLQLQRRAMGTGFVRKDQDKAHLFDEYPEDEANKSDSFWGPNGWETITMFTFVSIAIIAIGDWMKPPQDIHVWCRQEAEERMRRMERGEPVEYGRYYANAKASTPEDAAEELKARFESLRLDSQADDILADDE